MVGGGRGEAQRARAARGRRGRAACARRAGRRHRAVGALVACRLRDAAWRASPRGAVPVWQPDGRRSERSRSRARTSRRARAGAAQLAWIDAACDLVGERGRRRARHRPGQQGGHRALGRAGRRGFLGHTEHLQRGFGAREVVMAFWTPRAHDGARRRRTCRSRACRAAITPAGGRARDVLAGLAARARSGRAALRASPSPRSTRTPARAACSGDEEQTRIAPGHRARAARGSTAGGVRATLDGPVPAETAFRLALAGGAATASSRCTTTRRPSR